jgi:hypothetical protein
MGLKIAHFPAVKTLDFDFKFQLLIDQRLVREFAGGHFIGQAENLLIFAPPAVGNRHWQSPSAAPPSKLASRSS